MDGEADFEVTNIDGAILSAGRLIRKGFRAVLSQDGSYLERGGERIELNIGRNTFYLPARVCALETQQTAEAPQAASAVWGPPHQQAAPQQTAAVDEPVVRSIGGLGPWSLNRQFQARLQ